MAEPIDIKVKLSAELDKASQDIGKLKEAGAYSGAQGAKSLNKVQGLLNQLQNTDLSKLKGAELTAFLNNLSKLRHYLDTAGRSLTNYSETYTKQLKKVEDATIAVSKAQDNQAAALEKQKEALGKLDLKSKGYSYFNKETGRQVSNANTIADLYGKQQLKIVNSKGVEISGGAYDATTEKMGLKDYAAAREEVQQADIKVEQANIQLDAAKNALANTPTGGSIHPVTAEISQNSAETTNNISDIKAQSNAATAADISQTTAALDLQTASLNKQTSSLGRAFKQFTLYAVALRAIKKAVREAVKTVKELDRALTEQAMVTGLTRKQTYELLGTYQNMAARLGATTKEVSSTMTQFLRQGRSINESLKLTEAAVSAAKVAGISAADSINYLTTAINGFRLSADDAMKVSDKFAAVAASAATSYEEIAIALSKVAAQANLAGMSIDYTTALLTKGIETTREAPETIGTALKTVIARMRELGDYGETLGGDTDINNVESQLAYIGIALRDNNGELRSTEDVLNELGGKWDELNANQQAAIAKALAGTRQQSRLIAMMSDYERVIELQEIAERSQGATMAQMATYMEGMDAALNKVSVAWEKIVSSIADSEVIISLIDSFSSLLELVNNIVSSTTGMIGLLTTISLLGLSIFNRKMMEFALSKQQRALELQQQKHKLKMNYLSAQTYVALNKERITEEKKLLLAHKETIAKLTLIKAEHGLTDLQQKALDDANEYVAANEVRIMQEDLALQNAEFTVATYQEQNNLLNSQMGLLGGIGSAMSALTAPLFLMITLWKTIIGLGKIFRAQKAADHKKTMAEQSTENVANAMGAAGKIISNLGVWGIPIAIAVVAALIGATLGITAAVNNAKKNSFSGQVDSINQLSKEIYDLNKKSTAINTVLNKFDDLDNKILKTNDDLKEMSELLESAADSLSDEEKDVYESLSDAGKVRYLRALKTSTDNELQDTRDEQREKILKLQSKGGKNWDKFLTDTKDSNIVQAREAMYALNNAYLQTSVDSLKIDKQRAKAVEHITQDMLEQLDAAKAAKVLADQSQIDKYVRAMASRGDAATILSSDDYTISQRVEAFRELRGAVAELGDPEILEAFKTINKEWQTFSTMSKDTLDYIDAIGADIDGINELAAAIQKIGYTADKSADLLDDMFQLLQTGENLSNTIADMFGMDNYDSILNAYDKAFGTTILNMGQNIDKFKNTVDSFYEKAKEWATMSDTDKTSFISEHADLFKGEQGGVLLQAFESGNYARIEEALRANDALRKQREQLINDIDKQLKIEYARQELDYAYIRELEQNKKELEDVNKVYLASLKMRYDQQQAQLEIYKDLLQKETDALTDALEKRKEAYQKYFDAINKEYEEEEYEEKAQTLIANISKLSSSTNADAIAKTADLTKQLEELEKERLKELRQQAQEAMIKNIEDEVSRISDNLEKLLNNEQALLNAMMKDANSPSELIASLVSAQFANGNNTELGMQNYLQQMQATFASIMPGVDWSDVDVERRGDSLILNIMGKEIQLNDGEQQTIYDAIQQALRQLGYN